MSLFFFFGGQAKTWLVGINVWKKQSFCITTVTTVQASIKTTTQFRSVLVTCLDLYSLHSSSVIPNIQLVWSEQRACNLQTWVGLTLPQSKRCEKSMFQMHEKCISSLFEKPKIYQYGSLVESLDTQFPSIRILHYIDNSTVVVKGFSISKTLHEDWNKVHAKNRLCHCQNIWPWLLFLLLES